jgi:hypothetical protein
MLHTAIVGMGERPSALMHGMARALLDTYGYEGAVEISDGLSGAISAAHGAQRRAGPPRQSNVTPMAHALTVTDTPPRLGPAPQPMVPRGAAASETTLALPAWAWTVLLVAGLALGYAAAYALVQMVDAATARQIAEGASEW